MAGVEPTFVRLNGEDPAAYIVSANINRRQLTAGQRAMAIALIYPEPEKGGRGNKKERVEETSGLFSAKRLQQARFIARCLGKATAGAVLHGELPFDEALERATEQRDRQASDAHRMMDPRNHAPDLAELVTEGRMSLAEAHAALGERKKCVREAIEDGKRAAELGLIGFITAVATIGARRREAGARMKVLTHVDLAGAMPRRPRAHRNVPGDLGAQSRRPTRRPRRLRERQPDAVAGQPCGDSRRARGRRRDLHRRERRGAGRQAAEEAAVGDQLAPQSRRMAAGSKARGAFRANARAPDTASRYTRLTPNKTHDEKHHHALVGQQIGGELPK
jgi:hypothetical protein